MTLSSCAPGCMARQVIYMCCRPAQPPSSAAAAAPGRFLRWHASLMSLSVVTNAWMLQQGWGLGQGWRGGKLGDRQERPKAQALRTWAAWMPQEQRYRLGGGATVVRCLCDGSGGSGKGGEEWESVHSTMRQQQRRPCAHRLCTKAGRFCPPASSVPPALTWRSGNSKGGVGSGGGRVVRAGKRCAAEDIWPCLPGVTHRGHSINRPSPWGRFPDQRTSLRYVPARSITSAATAPPPGRPRLAPSRDTVIHLNLVAFPSALS